MAAQTKIHAHMALSQTQTASWMWSQISKIDVKDSTVVMLKLAMIILVIHAAALTSTWRSTTPVNQVFIIWKCVIEYSISYININIFMRTTLHWILKVNPKHYIFRSPLFKCVISKLVILNYLVIKTNVQELHILQKFPPYTEHLPGSIPHSFM